LEPEQGQDVEAIAVFRERCGGASSNIGAATTYILKNLIFKKFYFGYYSHILVEYVVIEAYLWQSQGKSANLYRRH
jgi:hypothetical protein